MTEWKLGDRVKMSSPDRYIASLRRLADRPGTVARVFVPLGSNQTTVRVEFDVARKGAKPRVEYFQPHELVSASAT